MKENSLFDNLFWRASLHDDEQAFKELFFEFYPSLCVYAGRFISPPETCEDIVQDTFYDIWKNRKKIKIHSSFKSLLIVSVKNNCLDHIRKQTIRQKYEEKISTEPSFTEDSPEDIYTVSEIEKILYSALNNLPENIKKAFELSRFENMTYQQIAAEMDISVKTVEAYISKVLNILRTELKDYLPLLILIFPGTLK
jgi:RNA polymerase sigma-70 factor (ECF subfamily)